MKNVLVVKANNRPDGVSTAMYTTFVENLDPAKVEIDTFDVYAQEMPYIGQTLFDAFGKLAAGEPFTSDEQKLMDVRQLVQEKFSKADVVVFAFPMWNLTIPAALHTFIDYIFQAGYTFSYNEDGSMNQLQAGKGVILLNARGGVYSGEGAAMECAVSYMQKTFGAMFGMNILEEVIIEGHNADPSKTQDIIAAGLERVVTAAKAL
ncbi:FMN-dependent NADH-azoreductase [Enterococcus camelliae]|uniref:FMN dependent NADH:quinone oxidoreductase n=1 Tax=Enterococcus camelliae TaxID=453959 RepID=A0ABW5TFX1_9ENTE